MMNKREKKTFSNMKEVGNYTKHAIESFEENIVNQTDYLEKVKDNKRS